jgi:hypothetical protein
MVRKKARSFRRTVIPSAGGSARPRGSGHWLLQLLHVELEKSGEPPAGGTAREVLGTWRSVPESLSFIDGAIETVPDDILTNKIVLLLCG